MINQYEYTSVGGFKEVIAESVAQCRADIARAALEHPISPASELVDEPLHGGAEFVLPDGRRIPRSITFIDVPANDRSVYYAVRHLLMRDVLGTRRRGRVWFDGDPCHVVHDDGLNAYIGPDGGTVIRVRTLFFHEADAR